MAPVTPTTRVARAAIATALGVAVGDVARLVAAGMPTERGRYDVTACLAWYVRYLQSPGGAPGVRNVGASVDKHAFAQLFGISENQLERLFQQGMPHEKTTSRRISIPMPAGRVWYHDYLVGKGKRAAAPRSIDEAKRRKMTAEADLAELELAKARDELMTVAQYDRVVLDTFSRVDVRLQSLPPRIAGAVLGAETIQEAQARIDPLIEEARTELRQGVDVPTVENDDEDDARDAARADAALDQLDDEPE